MSGAGGKWVASTFKEENIAKLRAAGYQPQTLRTGSRMQGRSFRLQDPTRGSCSSPILFVDWDFHFIPLSVGSCFTMAWTSMI